MSEISELEGVELYYALLTRRIEQWEQADTLRKEREAAEAFTRAFAELDAALKDGGRLPAAWAEAKPVLLSDKPTGSYLDERFGSDTVLLDGKDPRDGESKS
jgi:hypothetical protein